jgi:hypothetical protein
VDILKSLLGIIVLFCVCSLAFLGRGWDTDEAWRGRVAALEVVYRPADARPPDIGPPVEHVEAAAVVTVQQLLLVVDAEALNLRAGPSATAEVLRALPRGTVVVEESRSGNWVQVRTEDDAVGWMSARYLRAPTTDRLEI